MYDWKFRTFLIASPIGSLTTPYSATKRFATALKEKHYNQIMRFVYREFEEL